MGTIMRVNIADLIDPSFRKIYLDYMKNVVPQFEQIFNTEPSKMKQEKLSGLTDLPVVPVGSEGVNPILESVYQKYDKTLVHDTYKMGVRVTKEAWDDDLSGNLKKIPTLLGISSIAAIETMCARIFDRSQNGSYLGPDGKVLCATDHPNVGFGGTQSNRPTTNVDLSITSLEEALVAMRGTTTDAGIPMGAMLMPEKLLIAGGNEFVASRLLDSTDRPGDANNDINAVKKLRGGLKYFVWDYLTDADAFYLLARKAMTQLVYFWRERISQQTVPAPDLTDDAVYKVRFRNSAGWVDYRGIYGSIGA